MSLENILKKTKIAMATALASATIYAQQPASIGPAETIYKNGSPPVEINANNGNWDKTLPVRLFYWRADTSPNLRGDPSKDKDGTFDTKIYLKGSEEKGKITLTYLTTPLENPNIDAAEINNTESRIYYLSEEGIKTTDMKQRGIFMDSRGNISYGDLVPTEEADSLYMAFGKNLTDKIGESTEKYTEAKTDGLLNINLKKQLERYCAQKTKETGDKIRNSSNSKLEINLIPLYANETKFLTRKQIGREFNFKLTSLDGKEYPISIAYHLKIEHDGSLGKGNYSHGKATEVLELDSYTTPFKVPTKKESRDVSPFEGLWQAEKGGRHIGGIYITRDGMIFFMGDQGYSPVFIVNPDASTINRGIYINGKIGKSDLRATIDKIDNDRIVLNVKEKEAEERESCEFRRVLTTEELLERVKNTTAEYKGKEDLGFLPDWHKGAWIKEPRTEKRVTQEQLENQGLYQAGFYIDNRGYLYQLYTSERFPALTETRPDGFVKIYHRDLQKMIEITEENNSVANTLEKIDRNTLKQKTIDTRTKRVISEGIFKRQ